MPTSSKFSLLVSSLSYVHLIMDTHVAGGALGPDGSFQKLRQWLGFAVYNSIHLLFISSSEDWEIRPKTSMRSFTKASAFLD